MRMRRSVLQCVISASHASCSVWLHGFDPPSHRPFMVRHSGTGICWASGEKCESWAEQTAATTSTSNPICRRCGRICLPALMNLLAYRLVVNATDLRHGFGREKCEIGSAAVVGDLVRPFAARDDAGDSLEHENPTQGKLGHGMASRQKSADLFYGIEADIEIHSGKSFAYIKRGTVTIEVAVIVGREGGIATEFAGKETARQRHACQDANLLPFGLREEEFRGPLAEAIEDDLHGLDIRVLDCFQRFLDLFDADAVIAEFAGFYQIIEHGEDFGAVIDFRGRTMKLQQVQGIGREISQTVFNPRGQVFTGVAFDRLPRQAATRLGGNNDFIFAVLLQASDQTFAAAVAVDVSGIDKIDTGVDCLVQSGESIFVGNVPPRTANGPGAEADLRDFPTGATERAVVHQACFRSGYNERSTYYVLQIR